MNKTLVTITLSGLTAASMTLAAAACGSTAPTAARTAPTAPAATTPAAPATSPAASAAMTPPDPFASWSVPCQTVAKDLQNAGYGYNTPVGTYAIANDWTAPAKMTYGEMLALAAGSKAAGQGDVPASDDFAHLSYVENTLGNAQAASDLGDASTGVFSYLPAAAASNSSFNKVMREIASASAVNGWSQTDIGPVLDDCTNGIG